jgi:hypothetical protein
VPQLGPAAPQFKDFELEQISDHELGLVRQMVAAQRAIPALVVQAIIARLDWAESRLSDLHPEDEQAVASLA